MRRPYWLLLALLVIGCGETDAPSTPPPEVDAPAEAQWVGYVLVHSNGTYRLSPESLDTLGIAAGDVALMRRGHIVPLTEDGAFEAQEVGDDGTMSDIYEVWTGEPTGSVLGTSGWTRSLYADRVFGNVAAARPEVYAADHPTWYVAQIERGQGTTIPLGPFGAEPGSGQELEVVIAPTHVGEVVVEASWDGHDLGRQTTRLDPATRSTPSLRYRVPPEAVPTKEAPLILRDVTPTLPPAVRNDVTHGRGRIFVDRLTLAGPVVAPSAAEPPIVLEVRPLPTVSGALDLALDAEHVIFATPPLMEQAERLAAHRSASGTRSVAVPVEDVYWRDGHGEMTAQAIQRAIKRLETFGRLRYVLLAGDATLDRTDLVSEITIPAPMARTMYNGATAADRLYVRPADGPATGGPAIGRLPFRTADPMKAYVDRVIAYETRPPASSTRRLMRFVTSEGRFGVVADQMIENLFRRIVAESIPAVYDVEITNASAGSPFLWPPADLNDKVVESLNEGALFYTYVGHGFERGFDTLRVGPDRYRILHLDDVPRVRVTGTPPALFVVACTTAIYDMPSGQGVGEALLARPEGPIAYWGATRVCHPAANSLIGLELARRMARGDGRLGDIIRDAWDLALDPPEEPDPVRNAIRLGVRLAAGELDIPRLTLEGRWMYTLLGDPALRVAFPREDIVVRASHAPVVEVGVVDVTVELDAPLPDGTEIHLSLEMSRIQKVHDPEPVGDVRDPANAERIRRNHRLMNDWSIRRGVATLKDGAARFVFELVPVTTRLRVKAHTVTDDDVHHGAAVVMQR